MPQIGDLLGLHKELLDKNYHEYSKSYQFGPIDEIYGRKMASKKGVIFI